MADDIEALVRLVQNLDENPYGEMFYRNAEKIARRLFAAGYVSPARHDADIAAAKATGAAEVIAQVEAVLSPILANIEHALATGQAGAFPAPIAWAETATAIRAALTTGGEGRE